VEEKSVVHSSNDTASFTLSELINGTGGTSAIGNFLSKVADAQLGDNRNAAKVHSNIIRTDSITDGPFDQVFVLLAFVASGVLWLADAMYTR
jgi:hypothetical protein